MKPFSQKTAQECVREQAQRKTKVRKVSKKQAVKERALAKIKEDMWAEAPMEGPFCGICGDVILRVSDCEIDHIKPRGMGSGKRDDSRENLQLTHRWCNREKGSKRL